MNTPSSGRGLTVQQRANRYFIKDSVSYYELLADFQQACADAVEEECRKQPDFARWYRQGYDAGYFDAKKVDK
jgi:hypothetical protein